MVLRSWRMQFVQKGQAKSPSTNHYNRESESPENGPFPTGADKLLTMAMDTKLMNMESIMIILVFSNSNKGICIFLYSAVLVLRCNQLKNINFLQFSLALNLPKNSGSILPLPANSH
jgi:hypothetical protein